MSNWFRFDELELPTGERLIWQGRPGATGLAVRVFHMRLVVAYFVLLFAARVVIGVVGHQPWLESVAVASHLVIPLAIAMALLGGLALLYSRTTRYVITNRRVLLQFGAVLPMTLNIPFAQISSASVKEYADGSGDIPLAVTSKQRLAFLLIWPHVRPWRLTRVEPMLRCVPDVANVADVFAKTLKAELTQAPDPVVSAMPVPQPAQLVAAVATAA